MAKQTINIGTVAGDGTGDGLRTALDKVNDNFDEVYAADVTAAAHIASTSNPHSVTKSQVGLGNCDNTSDANKPISTATQTALDLKAPLASPALTGTPTAPTAAGATSTTQIATTAFVQQELNSLLDGAPAALNTLNELAAAVNDDASYAATITTALSGKAAAADLSSHTGNTSNPHSVTKSQVGLGNCDNTSDANKPISTATQTALDGKQASLTAASQAEMEAGTEAAIRSMSPLRVAQAIAALAGGGGGAISTPGVAHVETDGNNTTGDGSMNAPWATIQKAIDEGFRVVQLGAGTFSGALDLGALNNVTITGRGSRKTVIATSSYMQWSPAASANQVLAFNHLTVSDGIVIKQDASGSAILKGVDVVLSSNVLGRGATDGSNSCHVILDGLIEAVSAINCDGNSNVGGTEGSPGPSYNAGAITLRNGARAGSLSAVGGACADGSSVGTGGVIDVGEGCVVSAGVSANGGSGATVGPAGAGGTITLRPGSRVTDSVTFGGGADYISSPAADGTLYGRLAQFGGASPGVGNNVKMCVVGSDCIIDSSSAVSSFSGAPASLNVTNGYVTAAS